MHNALENTARKRDAVRILFILDEAGTKPERGCPAGAVAVVKAERRLQALDFWVRCPDYLAAELLAMHEKSPSSGFLDEAVKVMSNGEPEVRRVAMLRFLFGAFEHIDDSMSTLMTLGLATIKRSIKDGKKRQTDFYLLEPGRQLAKRLAEKSEYLAWYQDRAALVAMVAGTGSGAQLKDRQYKQAEYANARWGESIGPITKRVQERLEQLIGSTQ